MSIDEMQQSGCTLFLSYSLPYTVSHYSTALTITSHQLTSSLIPIVVLRPSLRSYSTLHNMHFSLCTRTLRTSLQYPQSIHRYMYSSIRTMTTKHDIEYSSNSDPEKVADEVTALTDGQGRWNISATRSGLEREFKFKTFKTTWAFMNAVAEQAAKKKHHPEWSNVRHLPLPCSLSSSILTCVRSTTQPSSAGQPTTHPAYLN